MDNKGKPIESAKLVKEIIADGKLINDLMQFGAVTIYISNEATAQGITRDLIMNSIINDITGKK